MRKLLFAFGALLLVLGGLITGVFLDKNWQNFKNFLPEINFSFSPPKGKFAPSEAPALLTNCHVQPFSTVGVTMCLPKVWAVRSEESPKNLLLGRLIIQSPNFDAITDQSVDGLPTISIKGGYQLSISATRITASSNVATTSELKDFWQTNRAGHAISRQEERTVDGLPAIYHFLASPKEGNQVDIHFIKSPLLYDINFFFNGATDPLGEDLFRQILDKITLTDIDPQLYISDEIVIVSPASGSGLLAGKPAEILVKRKADLEIGSQAELPTVIRRLKTGGTPAVLGTAMPVLGGVTGLTNATTFSFTWQKPEAGDLELVALVVKSNGKIYESEPVEVFVEGKLPAAPVR